MNEPIRTRFTERAGVDYPVHPKIVNVNGGAIAISHQRGASGGRSLGTLAHVPRERTTRWGMAAICIGVGQSPVVVLENGEAA